MIDTARHKVLLLAGVGGLAAMGLLGAGALTYTYMTMERTPHIVEQGGIARGLTGATMMHDDVDGEPYVPTSQYVEPGADSNEVTLGFAAGEKPEEQDINARMDDADVQEVIAENQNDLITCYAEALGRGDEISGRVDFHFRVASDGHVAMVKVTRSELADQPTEDCFVKSAAKWSFPKTHTAQLVKFDTNFTFAY